MAAAAAADRLILVGDPGQLTQPSRAAHPGGAANSALDHLLCCPQDHPAVIPPGQGVFLDTLFRMQPDICTVVSRPSYDGQLDAVENCRHLDLRDAGELSGTRVRFVPIAHHGNTASSPEEAAAVRDLVAQLTGATFVDHRRRTHTLTHRGIAVITPYNAQGRTPRPRAATRCGPRHRRPLPGHDRRRGHHQPDGQLGRDRATRA